MTNMTKVVQNLMCFLLSWWNIPTLCHWKSRACRPKWKWFQQVQVDNAQKARALYSRLLPKRPFASNVPPCFCDKVSLWNNSFCVQRCFCHCDGAIVLQHVIVSLLYFDFLHSVVLLSWIYVVDAVCCKDDPCRCYLFSVNLARCWLFLCCHCHGNLEREPAST